MEFGNKLEFLLILVGRVFLGVLDWKESGDKVGIEKLMLLNLTQRKPFHRIIL
jgi:hypothetical protein